MNYDLHIRPIFEAACFRCHGPERPKSGFRLDNRESALKGGNNGIDIIPGDGAASPLIHFTARLIPDMEMPPPGKGDPLTTDQVALLRAWIDQGARWPADRETAQARIVTTITPIAQWISVSGDERNFRANEWMREGFSAGYDQLTIEQPIGRDASLSFESRALFHQQDYRVALGLAKPTLGFVRGGYDQYRKYFDDTGGYYAPFGSPPSSLDRDFYLDLGRAWIDLGLTLPDLPRLTVGYEYQFREGERSTLQWGQVFATPFDFFGRSIYPATKAIDEHTHIVKADLTYEAGGVWLEDNLRLEYHDLETGRVNVGEYRPQVSFQYPDILARHNESYDHRQLANSFRAEKQLLHWLFLSAGYLYSQLDGDAGFRQSFSSVSSLFPLIPGDEATRIVIQQDSHTVNLNTLLRPLPGLSASAGVQGEWLRREGMSDGLAATFIGRLPYSAGSNLDRSSVTEDLGLRYDRIPFTVLFAEARFQQEWFDHYEQNILQDGFDDPSDFLRETDSTGDLKEYRAGFALSPWPRVALESSYRRRDKLSDYNHPTDTNGWQPTFSVPGNGYPAFLKSRTIESDDVEAKLVLKPLRWLKTTLKYQLLATDYRTTSDSPTTFIFDGTDFVPVLLPGGEILSGNEDAHVYSLNVTLSPWQRLYCSATLSYRDSRMVSGVNDGSLVAPYQGEITSALASLNFWLNEFTDLNASYSFSRADYEQESIVDGLPLGIRYDRHGLTAGLRRRIGRNVVANLMYVFFRYDEPTLAGANDYTGHGLLASLAINLP